MTSPASAPDRDEVLGRLAEAIAESAAAGRTVDLAGLARQFGVSEEEALRCKRAIEAIELALGEDLARPLPSDLPPPSLPAEYELLGEIGRGGMGVVYRVRQRSLGRTIALKVLRPGELIFGDAIRRFRQEAQSLARLRHRHIVAIHDVGESNGHVYYTMDLVEGTSLAEVIRRKEMTPTRAVRLLRQVAGAIAHAHAQGIIHRDLKPGNILIDGAGDAYVVDFGLARDAAVKGDLTTVGHLMGTPAYMSPEQARGDSARIGEASDVYSLGTVLYECLAGRPPFRGRSLADLIQAVLREDPVPTGRVAPRTPRDLDIITLKAMEKDPARRYATVRAMLEDLERFEEGRPILARRPSLAYRAARFAGRHAAPIAAAGVTGLSLLLLLLFFVVPRIGKTPDTLLATAEELHAAGEHPGAVLLCERALQQKPGGETAERIDAALLRCRLEVVRAWESQGRWPEAQALCEKMEKGSRREAEPEVLWELARCLAKRGNGNGAAAVLERFKDMLEDQQRHKMVATWESPDPTPVPNLRVRMLERAAPALLDPNDPGHDAAGVLFVQSFAVWGRHDSEVDAWLASQGERAADFVVALLRFLPREQLGTEGDHLYETVTAIPGARLERALVALARDPRQPLLPRRFAANLLAARLDLPVWLGSWRDKSPGEDDPRLIEKAAALAEAVLGRPVPEAYRFRIDAALKLLEEGPHNSDFDVWWISEWLQHHTGVKPTGRELPERVAAWRQWAKDHAAENPVDWILRALRLPSAPAPSDLLQRYLRCGGLDERILLHQLLVLTAPAGTAVPLRRYGWGMREPGERAMEWSRALRGDRAEPPYLLRIAHLSFEDGRPEPKLQWQETRPILIGDRLMTDYHFRIELQPSQDLRLIIPGLSYQRGIPLKGVERRRHSALLKWTQSGLDFTCGQTGPQGIVVVDNDLYSKHHRQSDTDTVRTDAILAVALPGNDAREWTLADWKAKIQDDLKFLLNGLESEQGRQEMPFYMRYQVAFRIYPQLAAHFALPQARDTLARLHTVSRTHRFLGKRGHSWLPARLMAGDPAPLAQSDCKATLVATTEETDSTLDYACRLYQTAQDPKIRETALDLLQEQKIPDGVALALRSAGPAAPSWLSEQMERAQDRSRQKDRGLRSGCRAVAAVGVFLSLALLARVAWPRLTRQQRLRPAALLVLLGLLVVATVAEVDGMDLLPDAAGYALGALGAAILAFAARGWARWIPAAAFALAAVVVAFADWGPGSRLLYQGSTVLAAIAIATLPALILGLQGGGSRSKRVLLSFVPLGVLILALDHVRRAIPAEGASLQGLFAVVSVLTLILPALTALAWGALFHAAGKAAQTPPA